MFSQNNPTRYLVQTDRQLQAISRRFMEQINGASTTIPHVSQQFTIGQLQQIGLARLRMTQGDTLKKIEAGMILPAQRFFPRRLSDYTKWVMAYTNPRTQVLECGWEGYMARGVIFMKSIYRREGASPDAVPYISNISLNIYRNIHGPLTDLRYVFFESVTNNATVNLLERTIKLKPSTSVNALVTFEYASNRYLEILGTRVGRVVGHMLLEAYPAGTHQIARIHIFKSHLRGVNLRFDIEPNVPRLAEAPAPRTSFMATTLSHLRNAAGTLFNNIHVAPIGSYPDTDNGTWGPGPPPPAGYFSIDASPYCDDSRPDDSRPDDSPPDDSRLDDSRPDASGIHIFTKTQPPQADSSSTGGSRPFKCPNLGRHSEYDRGIKNDAAVAATGLMTGDMSGAIGAAVAIVGLTDDTDPPESAYTPAPGSSPPPGDPYLAGADSSSPPGQSRSTSRSSTSPQGRRSQSKSSSLTRRRRSTSRPSLPHRRRGSLTDRKPPGSPYHGATPITAPNRPILPRRTSTSPRGPTGAMTRPVGGAKFGTAAATVTGIAATCAASRRNRERNNTSPRKITESSASATNRDSDAS